MQLHYHRVEPHGKAPAMNAILQAKSTLTDRYQTTVPEPVRRALGLKKRDAIHYELLPDGQVRLSRVDEQKSDPAISAFLGLLENDMPRPNRVAAANAELVTAIQQLVLGVDFDIDEALSPDNE
jgi:antitoxin PrlF